MIPGLAQRSAGHRELISGSLWLITATIIAALGGFVFWLIAAHVYSASDVGRASALFISAQFLNYATGMGLQVAVARYAPDRTPAARTLFEWALLYTTTTSVIGVACFFALAPDRTRAPLLVFGDPAGFVLFLVIVIGMSLSLLVDVRFMVLRRWRWVFGRALFVTLVRLPFLWLHPLRNEALWLFILVGGSQALSGYLSVWFVQHRLWHRLRPLPQQTRRALHYASVNYLGQLAVQAPFFGIPLIVLLSVHPSTNAAFYVAWSIMAVVFLSIQAISQALLAEGKRSAVWLRKQVRVTLILAVGLAAVSAVLGHVGATLVTDIFGSAYARAASVLPTLTLAMIPWAVTATFLAEVRVREQTMATLVIGIGFAAFTLVPAVLVSGHGALHDVADAWLYGNAAAACLAWAVARIGGKAAVRRPAAEDEPPMVSWSLLDVEAGLGVPTARVPDPT